MKEVKGCLIEYISGNMVAVNLNKIQSIYYHYHTEHDSFTINFDGGGDDYYMFTKNVVTESSWALLQTMLRNL